MKKLFLQAFGCRMSVADGEELARPLLSRGFVPTGNLDEADAAILNTCTVRQHAEDRAVSMIGRLKPWKDGRPDRLLIVAGCAAQRLGVRLRLRFPHVDLVVGAKSIEQVPEILEQALRERFDWALENRRSWKAAPSPRPTGGPGGTSGPAGARSPVCACVTVMRGCNYSCAYCIVPSVRGRELYRPMEAVLSDIREKIAAGAREVALLGQTVNSYRSEGADFADLLRAADKLEGLARIRFMSPHPYFVNDRMIRAMAECPKVCRHLHLPLQSGSDRVLKLMRRNYTVGEFLDKAARLRRALPGIEFTTDAIAGFPGETEEDFEATLRALEALDPCSAYCFQFSPRPGTEAAGLADPVPEPERERRLARLLEAVEGRMREHLRRWLGREVFALLERPGAGRIEHYFPIRISPAGVPGTLARAVVTGVSRTGLKGDALCSGAAQEGFSEPPGHQAEARSARARQSAKTVE